MIAKEIYNSIFREVDINDGDILLIASDLKNIIRLLLKNKLKFNGNEFIDYFLNRVGENGTLLFPTFNFDFCNNIDFHYYKTKSKMGYITNIALGRKDFVRTKHPIYSFAVAGKLRDSFFELNNIGAFDIDSPFALLHQLKAKMLLLDVDYQNSFTFVHYVEQCNNVNYRFHKEFTANYTDKYLKTERKTYSMFVRKEGIETNVNPIGKILEQKGVSKCYNVGKIEIKLIDLAKSFGIITKDIKENFGKNLHVDNK